MRPFLLNSAAMSVAAFGVASVLFGSVASAQEIVRDFALSAAVGQGERQIAAFPSVRDPNVYYYIPTRATIPQDRGLPRISFVRFNEKDAEATDEGGIVSAYFQLGISENERERLADAVKDANPNAVLRGPVVFEDGSYRLLTAVEGNAPVIIGEGSAPTLEGDRLFVTALLNQRGANQLWTTFQTGTPSFTVELDMSYKAYRAPIQATIEADFKSIYNATSFEAAVQAGISNPQMGIMLGADIKKEFDKLRRDGAIKITYIGEDENQANAIDAAYDIILKQMFEEADPSTVMPEVGNDLSERASKNYKTAVSERDSARERQDAQRREACKAATAMQRPASTPSGGSRPGSASSSIETSSPAGSASSNADIQSRVASALAEWEQDVEELRLLESQSSGSLTPASNTEPENGSDLERLQGRLTAHETQKEEYERLRDHYYMLATARFLTPTYLETIEALDEMTVGRDRTTLVMNGLRAKLERVQSGSETEFSEEDIPGLEQYIIFSDLILNAISLEIQFRNLSRSEWESGVITTDQLRDKYRLITNHADSQIPMVDAVISRLRTEIEQIPQSLGMTSNSNSTADNQEELRQKIEMKRRERDASKLRLDELVAQRDAQLVPTGEALSDGSPIVGIPSTNPPSQGGTTPAKPSTSSTPQIPAECRPSDDAGDTSFAISLATRYRIKTSIKEINFIMNMNKSVAEEFDTSFAADVPDLTRYLNNERVFATRALDRLAFGQRDILVDTSELSAADFDSVVSTAGVYIRKEPEISGRQVKTDDIVVTRGRIEGNPEDLRLTYLADGDRDADQFNQYQYKVDWTLKGGVEIEGDWQDRESAQIPLAPPVKLRTVTISLDPDFVDRENVAAATVRLYSTYGGRTEVQEVQLQPSEQEGSYSTTATVITPRDSFDYEIEKIFTRRGQPAARLPRVSTSDTFLILSDLG